MEKPPIVLIDGDLVDVTAILGYAISELIDGAVRGGMQRARIERLMVKTTQQAIIASRAEAYRNAVQEGEKHYWELWTHSNRKIGQRLHTPIFTI